MSMTGLHFLPFSSHSVNGFQNGWFARIGCLSDTSLSLFLSNRGPNLSENSNHHSRPSYLMSIGPLPQESINASPSLRP